MKHAISLMTAGFAALALSMPLLARTEPDKDGLVTYCLPSTVISLEVEAVHESFHAGPYAKYAEKYLGVKARQKDESTVQIKSIKMTPYVEADQSRRYSIQVPKGDIDGDAFRLSSSGLISFTDAAFGEGVAWRFPSGSRGDFSGKGISSNLTSESTTLYRNDKKESSYGKIAVQQNMVVEKSAEKKAAETAGTIFRLRQKRLQIVTGDTDATYSGEAMGAAIAELARLEEEYMTLFVGYSDFRDMAMSFDIVPDGNAESQMYVAFRISDTAGLLPADNLSGKPVVMEIVPQPFSSAEVSAGAEKNRKDVRVHYRIPAMCTVRITDGMNLLLQSRIPVYQLGQESSLPVNVKLNTK